ncbi:MAG TPA: hypothetical protein VJ861_03555 [Treponemataceae bacterium]|nr:hypothetical protein [Treponemataceae bacterium]
MKLRILPFLCIVLLVTSCVKRPADNDVPVLPVEKAIIQDKKLDGTEKSIEESDKALFENFAKEKIKEAQKKWPQFSENEIIALLQKQIFVGMSKDAMIVSWGKPLKITSSTEKFRKIETYTYPGKSEDVFVQVYIQKDRITGWQK